MKIKLENYTIQKRGYSWYIYIPKKICGNNVFRATLGTDDKNIALKRARDIFNAKKQENDENIIRKNSFLANATDFLAVNTNPLFKEHMNRCFIPYFSKEIGNRAKINDINKLTNLDLKKYVDHRKQIPSKKKNNTSVPVKPSTIIRENSTLRTFFKWCYENERINKLMKLPTIRAKENTFDESGNPIFDDLSGKRTWFTQKEIDLINSTLLKEIEIEINRHTKRRKQLLYYYINILHHTGVRPCEIRITFWNQFIPNYKNGGLLKDVYNAKQNRKRDIALSPYVINLLSELKKHQQDFCEKHNILFNENEIKIISICNSNLEKNTFNLKAVNELDNGFRKLLDRCGIDHNNQKVLYSYRHTYISTLVENQVPIINIAQQCGTSSKMIEDHYNQSSHLANMDSLFLYQPNSPIESF